VTPLPEYTHSPARPEPPCFALIRPGVEPRPRLSSYLLHNSEGPRWRLSERGYPDGGREWSITPVRPESCDFPTTQSEALPARTDGARTATSEQIADRPPRDYARESAARARRTVYRLGRHGAMRNMYTLTFPGEGVHDYGTAYKLVSGFIRDKGGWLRERGYLAVAELHPRGHGWHWHVLFRGPRMPRPVLIALQRHWTAYVRSHAEIAGWDGRSLVRHHVKRWSSARVASRYAGKYVAKNVGEGLAPGRQRYLRAEGLELPPAGVSYHPSWLDCLGAIPSSPHFWHRLFDGRPDAPFLYVSWEPPPT